MVLSLGNNSNGQSSPCAIDFGLLKDTLVSMGPDFLNREEHFRSSLECGKYQKCDQVDCKSYTTFLLNLGYAYETHVKNFIRAKQLYELGKEIHETRLDTLHFSSWAFAVHSLANIYTRFGDFQRAISMLSLLQHERVKRDPMDPYLPGLHLDLSLALHSGGKTREALSVMNDYPIDDMVNRNYGDILKARYLLDLDEIEEAQKILLDVDRQLDLLPETFMRPSFKERAGAMYELKSRSLRERDEMAEAISLIDSAIALYETMQGRSIAKLLNEKARFLIMSDRLDKAKIILLQAQLALNVDTSLNAKDAEVFLENSLVDNYQLLGDWYVKRMGESENLKHAIQWYDKAIEVDFFIRKNLVFDLSRSRINVTNKSICEKGMRLCFLLYRQTDVSEYLTKAYLFAEYNKAALVRESINTQAIYGRGISSSEREIGHLKSQLGLLKRQVRESTLEDSLDQTTKNELIKVELRLKELEEKLKSDIPPLIDEYGVANLEELQSAIGKGQVFLNYFQGEHYIYRFDITTDDISVDSFLLDEDLLNSIQEFKSSISQPWNTTGDREVFLTSSQVLEPLFDIPDNGIGELLISPDENLHGIAIGAMWNRNMEHYWIKNFNISYQYSPTMWVQMKNNGGSKKIRNVLTIAPQNFKDSLISALPLLLDPFESTGQGHVTLSLLDQDANYQSVKEHISGADIIHFHTHGGVSPVNKLELFDRALYVDELEDFNIISPLVVLSSCESGTGNLSLSEGPLSMARGFALVGVPTTIMTAWKVNNRSTQDILHRFYNELSSDLGSSNALRNAQLDYLNNASSLDLDPYYWAGIMHCGSDFHLEREESGPLRVLFAFFILAGLLIFYRLFLRPS